MYTNTAERRERILTTKPGSSQLPEPWPSPCPRLRGRGSCDVASGCAVAPPLAPRSSAWAPGRRQAAGAAGCGHVRTRAAWVGTGRPAPEVGVTVPRSVLDGTAEWLRWARAAEGPGRACGDTCAPGRAGSREGAARCPGHRRPPPTPRAQGGEGATVVGPGTPAGRAAPGVPAALAAHSCPREWPRLAPHLPEGFRVGLGAGRPRGPWAG